MAATRTGRAAAATGRAAAGFVAVALATVLAGCGGPPGRGGPEGGPGAAGGAAGLADGGNGPDGGEREGRRGAPAPAGNQRVRLIGDGSTAYTGQQRHLMRPRKLSPGQKPPQFVVFSWDGAGEDSQKLFSRFRKVARDHNAHMTYFLSGVYLVPKAKRALYKPPGHPAGRSDIGFNDVSGIRDTLEQLRGAWLEGNEIGTHFNGHFCGPKGVGTWTPEQWRDETEQAKEFVKNWRTNAGLEEELPLPFDYDRELIGARTPCLEGRGNFLRAAGRLGLRYDSSGVARQVWPGRREGLWDLSLQLVPVPGRSFETLAMDYNFLVNQSGKVNGDPARHAYWGSQMRNGLLAAFHRAYRGNRAPLVIGNHFESWNGGIYMDAVEDTVKAVCTKPEVRCVSFRELTDWLDVQDPLVLAKLRTLKVGQAPGEGWEVFLAS
ncbi:hypothetical protein [Streptomyces sp. GC420]|uniref:hypothetical protein n=1 Tax=Streptomyces sp. GC420 TaxID=2697568 RepID=UPI001414EF1E|nr:hypothetical protein [Streptomyces sp. GC420]NBM16561.1 hypothetical protein [Streptomyces sp. GC420]